MGWALLLPGPQHLTDRSSFFSILLISIATRKKACNTATCVTKNLADRLKKRGGIWNDDFMPTGVDRPNFGRRRRNPQN